MGLSEEEFDALFAGEANEELGDVHELGWYGVVRWGDRPGGLLITLDSDGRRRAWFADSSEALDAHWTAVADEYERYHEECDAYYLAIEERSNTPSGLNLRV